ncbi:hypothetical protein [Acanthopleuribacter pedis]|uniref:Uncharacterized protein n=1 Tax=Acanthopleuribacter pedis TaxID=442870 RepID=A0A8J7QB70_9BACT|nr:hypothetical protein [Acanthopleuribacter pedis]MBO1322321.1 hypothetical protein [Acanthopleuribacter pedis]
MSSVSFKHNQGVNQAQQANAAPPSAFSPPTTGTGVRTNPQGGLGGGAEMTRATTETSAMAPSATRSKRIQFVQAHVKTGRGSALSAESPRELLEKKAEVVFSQVNEMVRQGIIDQRGSTTQIVSVPEFYWNDNEALLSQHDKTELLGMVQAKVREAGLPNAIFVMGSVVTSEPAELMRRVQPHHMDDLGGILDLPAGALREAQAESLSQAPEDFTTPPSQARVELAAVISLAAAMPTEDGGSQPKDLSQDVLNEAARTLNTIKENQTHLAMLIGHASPRTMTNHFEAFLAADTPRERREALGHLCPRLEFTKNADGRDKITAFQTFLRGYEGNTTELMGLARSYKRSYAPFLLARSEFSDNSRNGALERGNPALKILREGPNTDVPQLHETGRQMFKTVRNEAIVVNGDGNSAPRLVQKYNPSDIDVPSYSRAKTGDEAPLQSRSYKQFPGGTAPDMSEAELTRHLTDAGRSPQDQMVPLPRDGQQMGLVICRDIDSDHFTNHIADSLSQADVFMLISAGISEATFEKKAPHGPVVAQNDGIRVKTHTRYGNTHQKLAQKVFEQREPDGQFGPARPVPSTLKDPDGPLPGEPGKWSVSDTYHLPNTDRSRASSWPDGIGDFDVPTLKERIALYAEEVAQIEGKLSWIDSTGNAAVADRDRSQYATVTRSLPFSQAQKDAWRANPQAGPEIMAEIQAGLRSDLESADQLLQAAQRRLAQLTPPSTENQRAE